MGKAIVSTVHLNLGQRDAPVSKIFMTPKTAISICLHGAMCLLACGCATSTSVQRLSESKSAFSEPPVLITSNYPASDIFRIYQRGATGFVSIQSLREDLEQRADDFSKRQGKSFVVLGEQISHPPYILGNFPRIEIVFALIDKPSDAGVPGAPQDKYSQLERLKKLLDEGALTREEYETEKAKLLGK